MPYGFIPVRRPGDRPPPAPSAPEAIAVRVVRRRLGVWLRGRRYHLGERIEVPAHRWRWVRRQMRLRRIGPEGHEWTERMLARRRPQAVAAPAADAAPASPTDAGAAEPAAHAALCAGCGKRPPAKGRDICGYCERSRRRREADGGGG